MLSWPQKKQDAEDGSAKKTMMKSKQVCDLAIMKPWWMIVLKGARFCLYLS